MATQLHGIIPPMTTPFTAEGEIDERAYRAQVRWFLRKGVHGVCVGGSTGEGHTLTRDEFKRLMVATCEEVNGRLPVVAGIIANSTREAILRARDVEDLTSPRCRSRRSTTCSSRTSRPPTTTSRPWPGR